MLMITCTKLSPVATGINNITEDCEKYISVADTRSVVVRVFLNNFVGSVNFLGSWDTSQTSEYYKLFNCEGEDKTDMIIDTPKSATFERYLSVENIAHLKLCITCTQGSISIAQTNYHN